MSNILSILDDFSECADLAARMLLFLIFFPRAMSDLNEDDHTDMPTWKEAVLVLALSLAFFIFALLGSIVFVYALPEHIRKWANLLGVVASVLAGVQYIPQIFTTWRLQTIGSLSVPMMCIQTPGSFVFASSLAARLGPAGWSTWSLFLLTGCLQGCLLVMCLWFLWRDRKARKAGVGGSGNGHVRTEEEDSEQTPLLAGEIRGAGT
jgi:uncharacterized protein with PQ loop repeat